jgi:hypothetical protein
VEEGGQMMRIICPTSIIQETLELLRRGGARGEERVALWLSGAAPRTPARVLEIYEPDQIAEVDYFRLPPASMRALMAHLTATRRRIIAQIHTHPGRAYHSTVDAEWAIVRHVGALSLVLPKFAASTTPANFLRQVKIYEYSAEGAWVLKPGSGPKAVMEISS